jgi:Fe-S-cluster containining protein
MTPLSSIGAAAALWSRVAGQYPAYDIVLPGDPGFVCRAELCRAYCCHALTVPLDDGDVSRLTAVSGLRRERFLECEAGEPIALPLSQPYVLARQGGHCALLAESLSCSAYEGRPAACRAYPFAVLTLDPETARPLPGDGKNAARAADGGGLPVLIRHRECPGFDGPAVTEADWEGLVLATRASRVPPANERQ